MLLQIGLNHSLDLSEIRGHPRFGIFDFRFFVYLANLSLSLSDIIPMTAKIDTRLLHCGAVVVDNVSPIALADLFNISVLRKKPARNYRERSRKIVPNIA